MDYKHWCKFLEPEILVKWEVELIKQGRVHDIRCGSSLKHFNNFNDFINYTLSWCDTEDGHQFWSEICNTEPRLLINFEEEQKRYFYGL